MLGAYPQRRRRRPTNLNDGGIGIIVEEVFGARGQHAIDYEDAKARLFRCARMGQPLQPLPLATDGLDTAGFRAMRQRHLQHHCAHHIAGGICGLFAPSRRHSGHGQEAKGLQLDNHRHIGNGAHRLNGLAHAYRTHRVQVFSGAGIRHVDGGAQRRWSSSHAYLEGVRVIRATLPHAARAD